MQSCSRAGAELTLDQLVLVLSGPYNARELWPLVYRLHLRHHSQITVTRLHTPGSRDQPQRQEAGRTSSQNCWMAWQHLAQARPCQPGMSVCRPHQSGTYTGPGYSTDCEMLRRSSSFRLKMLPAACEGTRKGSASTARVMFVHATWLHTHNAGQPLQRHT